MLFYLLDLNRLIAKFKFGDRSGTAAKSTQIWPVAMVFAQILDSRPKNFGFDIIRRIEDDLSMPV